ncbi:hypothetical protein K8R03_03670 [Candidatus Kaiserbacteria bacterium]|nr:hypothetical protein [Candidatus Kaiserbacteria bacterium]
MNQPDTLVVPGEIAVPASELSPTDWAGIIRDAIEHSKPHFPFFTGFKSLTEWVADKCIVRAHGFLPGSTNAYLEELPVIICSRTPFSACSRPGNGEECLIVGRDGVVVLWVREFQAQDGKVDAHWEFMQLAQDSMLSGFLHPGVGIQVLTALASAAADSAPQMLARYEAVRSLGTTLEKTLSRIAL